MACVRCTQSCPVKDVCGVNNCVTPFHILQQRRRVNVTDSQLPSTMYLVSWTIPLYKRALTSMSITYIIIVEQKLNDWLSGTWMQLYVGSSPSPTCLFVSVSTGTAHWVSCEATDNERHRTILLLFFPIWSTTSNSNSDLTFLPVFYTVRKRCLLFAKLNYNDTRTSCCVRL